MTRGSAPTYAEDGEAAVATVIGQSCQRPDGSFNVGFARQQALEGGVPAKGRVFGGEVLINSTGTGTLGRVAMIRDPVSVATFVDSHVTLLRVRPDRADARFVAYLLGLPASREYIEEALSFGATKQRELSTEALRSHVLRLPGAQTQKVVADFLDGECERIERLIREARGLATTSRESHWEIARSELLSGTEGGPTTRLKHLVETPVGGTWGMEPGEDDVDVAVARVADFDRRALAVTDVPTVRSVSRAAARRLGLRTGDLLVEKSGGGERSPVGFVARYEGPDGAVSSNFIARLRPRSGTVPAYLQHLFGTLYAGRANVPYVRQVTGIQNLDVAGYLRLRVPDRDPHEQRSIAQRFVARLDLVNALEARCDRLAGRLSEYRDALITEAVTGKLDVASLSDVQLDESAHAVLEGEEPEVLAS